MYLVFNNIRYNRSVKYSRFKLSITCPSRLRGLLVYVHIFEYSPTAIYYRICRTTLFIFPERHIISPIHSIKIMALMFYRISVMLSIAVMLDCS